MALIRKTMNTVEEAKADLNALGYVLTAKKQRGCIIGKIFQKPKVGKRVDLHIGATLTDQQRGEHPELCTWLDRNAIAMGTDIVVFTAARREAGFPILHED